MNHTGHADDGQTSALTPWDMPALVGGDNNSEGILLGMRMTHSHICLVYKEIGRRMNNNTRGDIPVWMTATLEADYYYYYYYYYYFFYSYYHHSRDK